jgi:hypothetical protein
MAHPLAHKWKVCLWHHNWGPHGYWEILSRHDQLDPVYDHFRRCVAMLGHKETYAILSPNNHTTHLHIASPWG